MSVSNQTPYKNYTGTGTATTFAFDFKVLNPAYLRVLVNGVLQTTGYSVVYTNSTAKTGNVVFSSAPIAGAKVRLVRKTPKTRSYGYDDGGDLPMDILDEDFDNTVLMVQELEASSLQSLDTGEFDANGNRIVNVADPINPQDAATKAWAESGMSSQLTLATAQAQAADMANQMASQQAEIAMLHAGTTAGNMSITISNRVAAETASATATTKAAEAATSAANAATSEGNALAAQDAAELAETTVTMLATEYFKRDLGAKSMPPSVDNQGNPLVVGAHYWDTTSNSAQYWSGSAWVMVIASTYTPPAAITSLGSLTTAANKMPYTTASNVYATTDLTAAARTLLDDASVADMRVTLQLDSMALQAANSVAITGGSISGTSVSATTIAASGNVAVTGVDGAERAISVLNPGTSVNTSARIKYDLTGVTNAQSFQGLYHDGTYVRYEHGTGAGVTGSFYTSPQYWFQSQDGSVAYAVMSASGSQFGRRAWTVPNLPSTHSATPTLDASQSNVFELPAMTSNITAITITNPTAGQTINIRFLQDSTGTRTVAAPTGAKVDGSVTSGANRVSWMVLTYSSLAARWEGGWQGIPA